MRASPFKIVSNDWAALCSALAAPIVWGVHVAFPHLRPGASLPVALPAGVSVLALAVLGWRVARVRTLFVTGRCVQGVVTAVTFLRDRGRLEYEFPVQGSTVRSWCPVHRTRQVVALEVGQAVEILYDARDPRRSIVKALFAAEAARR